MREKSKGVWEVRVSVGRGPVTQRPRQVSRVVRGTKRDAQKRLAELHAEVLTGSHTDTKTTFSTLLDSWLEQQERLGRSPVTLRNLRSCVDAILWPALGRIELRKLRAEDIDRFYTREARLGKAPTTVRKYHRYISAALEQALRSGWIDANPARLATPPSSRPQEVVTPDAANLRRPLEEAERRNPVLAAALAVAALTGAPRGELCGVQWADREAARRMGEVMSGMLALPS